MRWLFAVFVLSLFALLWAAIAVARHIRRDVEDPTATIAAPESDTKQDPH